MAESKKTLTAKIEVKEIIYDVQNKTYLKGKALEAANNAAYEVASNLQASDDLEHDYQIRRSISDAFTELKSLLGEYLDETATSTDNKIKSEVDNSGTLELSFKLPTNYNSASADALGAGIGDYITYKTIADWYAINNPGEVEAYRAMAAEKLQVVKRALYKRSRPTRPTYTGGSN